MIGESTKRLALFTLVIGGSFYSGIFFYSIYKVPATNEINILSTKEFEPKIKKIIEGNFYLKAEDKSIVVQDNETKKWIESYVRDYNKEQDLRVSSNFLAEYLQLSAPNFDTEPVNAKLTFKNSRAQIFVPSSEGRRLNIAQSAAVIISSIINGQASASLVFENIEPEITLEKINNLGIEKLLGKGESDYGKSSASRIHNIKIGMSKFNGVILKPGEEFSFNKLLGEVDEKEGYQSELVIKNGQLVHEYGGGLCQVATTVFRGAILSGLKIVERKPHSFPVQYYNPQGFDATIYPGVVDLRFINNTEKHMLIQTKLAGSRLAVEIYGSDNNREIKIEGPVQYDKQPTGAMKAYFIRKIYQNGDLVEEKRFNSTYKPPPPSPLERNPLE